MNNDPYGGGRTDPTLLISKFHEALPHPGGFLVLSWLSQTECETPFFFPTLNPFLKKLNLIKKILFYTGVWLIY